MKGYNPATGLILNGNLTREPDLKNLNTTHAVNPYFIRMTMAAFAAALAVSFLSAAAVAQDKKPAAHVFAGYSSTTVDGAGNDGVKGSKGITGMTAACRATPKFGPRARMCTVAEFIRSPQTAAPKTAAWIDPTAGLRAPRYFKGIQTGVSCRSRSSNVLNWSTVGGKGITVSTKGTIESKAACGAQRPVACCAPRIN